MAVSTSPIAHAENRVGSSALNHTVAFDCGSGADFLIAFFRVPTDGTDVTVVKYAGVDMTHFATINGLECWYLAAPSSGSNNVTWTTGISERPYYAFSSWSGADGTTPVGTQATNSGNGNSLSTGSVPCPTDGVIVGCAHQDFANAFAASAGTLIGQFSQNGASQGRRIVHSVLTSTGSVDWSTTGSAFDWEAIGVPINAAAGGDTTAPTITTPTGAGGLEVCSGTVSTDEANGTLYAVATASATAPTALQVRNGQDHTGAAALRVVSQAVSATGSQTVASGAITGGAGTRYLHYMHEDAAGNRSAVVSSAGFSVTANATKIDMTIAAAAGLTGIRWAIFGASTIAGSASVVASGSAESFDGAGLISLDITGLGIAVGVVRYVVLTQSDGNPAQSPVPYGWHGPATTS